MSTRQFDSTQDFAKSCAYTENQAIVTTQNGHDASHLTHTHIGKLTFGKAKDPS